MTPRSVIYHSESDGFGGAEVALLTLIAGLDPDRWRPTLAYCPTESNRPLAERASQLGAEVCVVPALPPGARSIPATRRFSRWLHQRSPAVFHANLPWQLSSKWPLVAAASAGIPCVTATVHLFVDVAVDPSTRWQQYALGRRVTRYIAVSNHVARSLRAAVPWPADRITVVRNGVETPPPAALDPLLRGALRGGHAKPLALVPARLTDQKGHRYLLEAATRLPDVRFVLAGGGPLREALERQAADLRVGDRVVFLGERDDMSALLAACDLVVLPSINEGLPLVVLEAMVASRPVVATAVGGTPEAVTDRETGVLVPPRDPRALAEGIRWVTEQPEGGMAALGRAGRSIAEERFSAEAMVASVTACYEGALSGATARGRRAERPAPPPS
jgi:glycosyltransferase involved in cell wall biosynthesis